MSGGVKFHNSYLELKQDRFTILMPNGFDSLSDRHNKLSTDSEEESQSSKSLVLDYLTLKDSFGIDIEAEFIYGDIERDSPCDLHDTA